MLRQAQQEGNSNNETSVAFLERLLGRHSGRLNVIWDNAPAHDRVVELTPGDALAYYTRGCALADLGERQRALEDFGRAIALEPEELASFRQRALVYRQLGQPDKALADYDEILRLRPDDMSAGEERRRAVEEVGEH